MPETEQFSDLVGDIYDAVLDRSLWPSALKKASRFIEGAASAVFWSDVANQSGDVYFDDGGIPPYYRDLYFQKYAKFNPTTTPRFFAEVEVPAATSDLLSYDEFLRTRFYREWAQPQCLVDFVSVTLERSATKAAMFGVFRHERQGVVDEATRQRMRLLAPHIRRAVLISKVVDFKQSEAAMLAQTLDGLRAATILVDGGGRIVYANIAAHRLLDEGTILHAVGGRLVCSDAETDECLRDIFRAAEKGDAALGTRGIALPLIAEAAERHVVHVLPLASGERERVRSSHAASAAVFVHKAVLEAAPPPMAIAKAYKLTMMELRVLFAIVEIGGVPEVAEILGVAASTVKTHLSRVYEKTRTARQADLVRLVAEFSSPLRE